MAGQPRHLLVDLLAAARGAAVDADCDEMACLTCLVDLVAWSSSQTLVAEEACSQQQTQQLSVQRPMADAAMVVVVTASSKNIEKHYLSDQTYRCTI